MNLHVMHHKREEFSSNERFTETITIFWEGNEPGRKFWSGKWASHGWREQMNVGRSLLQNKSLHWSK